MELIKFDPSVEDLHKMITITSRIQVGDLTDAVQLVAVHDHRLKLRDARVMIEKKGKSMREEALKYQKNVIAREKELLAIITPEEMRLKGIEDEAKAIQEIAARRPLLSMRRQLLKELDPDVTDNFLLSMDNDQFMEFIRMRTEEIKADAAEEQRRNAESQRRQQDIAEAEECGRLAAIEKAKDQERIREVQEAVDKLKREHDEKYQAWLLEIGYKEDDKELWIFKDNGGFVGAFKHVGTFLK